MEKALTKCPTRYYSEKWIEARNLRSDDPRASQYKKRKKKVEVEVDDDADEVIFLDDDEADNYHEFGFSNTDQRVLSGSEILFE